MPLKDSLSSGLTPQEGLALSQAGSAVFDQGIQGALGNLYANQGNINPNTIHEMADYYASKPVARPLSAFSEVPMGQLPSGPSADRLPYAFPGMDMEDFYAQNQTSFDKVYSGLLGMVGKVGTKTLYSVGALAGLAGFGNNHKDYGQGFSSWVAGAADNGIAKFAEDAESYINNAALPIYQEAGEANQGFWWRATHDLNFWASDVTDAAAFMISSILPSLAVAKIGTGARLVSTLGKLKAPQISESLAAKAFSGTATDALAAGAPAEALQGYAQLVKGLTNSQIQRGTDLALSTIINTTAEAFVEANGVKNSVLASIEADPLLSQKSQYEKNSIAAKAAKETMLANSAALLFSNLWEAKLVLGKAPSVSSDYTKAFSKQHLLSVPERVARTRTSVIGGRALDVSKGIGIEGFYEENIQLAIQRLNEERAFSDRDNSSYMSGLLRQYGKQTVDAVLGNDPEAATSIGLGGIIGGMAGGIGAVREEIGRNKRLNEAQKYLKTNVDAFRGAGNVYQTETIDGQERVKFDPAGNPIYDQEKLAALFAKQSRILEITDLADVALEDGDKYLHKVYEQDLLARMAWSHFELGLGDQLKETFNNIASMPDEDMVAMGFDPKSRGTAMNKIAEMQASVTQLQKAYDTIQRNVIRTPGTTDTLFTQRKEELFRLTARQLNLDKLIRDADTEVTELESYLAAYDTSYDSATDSLVNDTNAKLQAIKLANRNLTQIEDNEAAKSELGQPADPAAVEEAKNNLKQATQEYEDHYNTNKETLDTLKLDSEGLYKYQKAAKNSLPQSYDLKIAQLKHQELRLSRNSVIQRVAAIADPGRGQKFFDKYATQVNESQSPKETKLKEPLGDKTAEQYVNYEDKVFRRQSISTQVEDITKEFEGAQLAEAMSDLSVEEIEPLLDQILNNNLTISATNLQNIKDSVLPKLNDQIADNKAEISELNAQISEITMPEDGSFPSPEDEQEALRLLGISQGLQADNRKLEGIKDKLNQIQEFTARVITDAQVRRDIADVYLVDADVIIQDMAQSDEGYDTEQDLANIDEAIKTLSSLRNIFQTREDNIVKEPEFKGFLGGLSSRIQQLQVLRKVVETRVSDRKLKDKKVLQSNIKQLEKNLGIGSPIYGSVSTLISSLFPAEFQRITNEIEELSKDRSKNDIALLATYESMQDLLNLAYQKSDAATRQKFQDDLKIAKEDALNRVMDSPITKHASHPSLSGTSPETYKRGYASSPLRVFSHILKVGLSEQGYTKDNQKTSPVNQYIQNKDPHEFVDNAKKDPREGSSNTQEELIRLIESHITYLGIFNLAQNLENPLPNLNEVSNELQIIKDANAGKDKVVAPSNQQLQSLRELSRFVFSEKPNTLYSAFAYLKGYAGTGKSLVIGQWLPKLTRLPLDTIFALGHNEASSANINSMLGKGAISPTTKDLEEALKTNPDLRLIVVDEVGFFNQNALNALAQAVVQYNNKKPADKQLKVILLGDPNQLSVNNSGKIQTIPDIENLSMVPGKTEPDGTITDAGNLVNNITNITPLTVRFRSNVNQVSNFSDKFISQPKDLSKEETIVTSNNPDLTPALTQAGNLTGVVGTKDFGNDVVAILRNSNLEDGRTRAIVTNPEKVAEYQNLLRTNGIPLDKVQVVSYVDVQGQTINEVYVDIENTKETESFYNNAMYVATSRATDFLLVGNMNLRNEGDPDILADKKVKDTQITDSGKEFQDARTAELSQIEKMLGAQTEDVKKAGVITTPTTTATGTTASSPAQLSVEDPDLSIAADQAPEQAPEEEDFEEMETPGSLAEQMADMNSTPVNTTEEFIHTLQFPTYTSTKNLVMYPGGETATLRDKTIKKMQEDGVQFTIEKAATRIGDDVFYVPVRTDSNNLYFIVLAPEKDGNGKTIPNQYRKLGGLSTKEIESLGKTKGGEELYNALNNTLVNKATVAALSESQIENPRFLESKLVEKVAVVKGSVADIRHMEFTYDPEQYKAFNLQDILKEVFKSYKVENEALVQKNAKIVIFTKTSLEAEKATARLFAGVPYLVLSDMRQANAADAPKKLYIRLDRRLLHKTDHAKFLEPITNFIEAAKAFNKLVPAEKGYGQPDAYAKEGAKKALNANVFIKDLAAADDANTKAMVDEYLGRETTPQEAKDIVTAARTMTNMYTKKNTYVKAGTRVNSTTRTFTKVEMGKKSGKLEEFKAPAKVVKVNSTTDAQGNKTIESVDVEWATLVNGERVVEKATLPMSEVVLTETEDGLAQKRLGQIWKSQLNQIQKKNQELRTGQFQQKLIPLTPTMERKKGGGTVETYKAPALLSDENSFRIDLEYLEDLFAFDSKGNSSPKNAAGIKLRIPVPREASDRDHGIAVNFKDGTNNSINNKTVTDYFIQSNFQALSPTTVSVKFTKKAIPATEPVAPKKAAPAGPSNVKPKPSAPIEDIQDRDRKEILTTAQETRNKFGAGRVVYSQPPSATGVFDSGAFTSDPSQSLYEITISTTEPNKAIFRFFASGDALSSALQNESTSMGSATNRLNVASDTTVDVTSGYGTAELRNGDWVITSLADTLFESAIQPTTPQQESSSVESEAPKEDKPTRPGRRRPGRRLSVTAAPENLGKALTQPEVLKAVKRFFPGMSMAELRSNVQFVNDAQMMRLSAGVDAWGLFKDNIIYLRTNPDNTVNSKVVRHEVFHAIFNNYLTKQEQERFKDTIRKEVPQSNYLTTDEFNEFVDEYLANAFMEQKPLSSFQYYIRYIIKKIKDFLNFVSPNIESLDDLFNSIDAGTISTRFGSRKELIDNFIESGLTNQTILSNCK